MNQMSLKFKSITENIVFSRNACAAFVHSLDPTIGHLNELKTVISEAVTNSIIHGYEEKTDGFIDINMLYVDKEVIVEIIDYGKGIKDIKQALEPLFTTSTNEERSGLGFTIMQVFSDGFEVQSTDAGTKIIIKKSFNE